VAAGLTTLKLIQEPGFYTRLSSQTSKLVKGIAAAASKAGITFSADSVGGMFGLYFSSEVPTSYTQMMASDTAKFNQFFHLMLDAGVYLAPSAFEAGFVSAQHDDQVIAATIAKAEKAFFKMAV
jgi:glutamate-1-semialdehyde 2,1-aminomutase